MSPQSLAACRAHTGLGQMGPSTEKWTPAPSLTQKISPVDNSTQVKTELSPAASLAGETSLN